MPSPKRWLEEKIVKFYSDRIETQTLDFPSTIRLEGLKALIIAPSDEVVSEFELFFEQRKITPIIISERFTVLSVRFWRLKQRLHNENFQLAIVSDPPTLSMLVLPLLLKIPVRIGLGACTSEPFCNIIFPGGKSTFLKSVQTLFI